MSLGAVQKMVSEKIWMKCREKKHFSPIFLLAIFLAMPQLHVTERQEEARDKLSPVAQAFKQLAWKCM